MNPYRIVQAACLGLLISRLRHGAGLSPLAARELPETRVSVIIPARDEEARIARCLESLEDVYEVIVVDDCSVDDTAALAEKHGATVVDGRALPAGWVGKPWALQQGLSAATGDIVVCLDADTIAKPGLVGAAVEALAENDFVSLASRFRCESAAETTLHASMLATLVYRFGPPNSPLSPDRVIANGQCVAFRREWFLSQGGFELNAGHMTDDVALARALAKRGARLAFLDGTDVIEVDMHDSVGDVWREWGRSLPMNDTTGSARQYSDLAFLWVTLALPLVRLSTGRGNRFDGLFLAIRVALNFGFSRAYTNRTRGVWLSPVSDLPAVVRLTQATVRPVRSWRGRTYGATTATRTADR